MKKRVDINWTHRPLVDTSSELPENLHRKFAQRLSENLHRASRKLLRTFRKTSFHKLAFRQLLRTFRKTSFQTTAQNLSENLLSDNCSEPFGKLPFTNLLSDNCSEPFGTFRLISTHTYRAEILTDYSTFRHSFLSTHTIFLTVQTEPYPCLSLAQKNKHKPFCHIRPN